MLMEAGVPVPFRPRKGGRGGRVRAGRLNPNIMKGKKSTSGMGAKSTFGSRRSMNPPAAAGGQGSSTPDANKSFQQMDPKRRQGSFEGAGRHARAGSRGHQ
jgi:hypothetical protein